MKKYIPEDTIKRLTIYLRNLLKFQKTGKKIISSKEITSSLNILPHQFRKDLSYFGGFGKRGVGYNVEGLINAIKKIVGIEEEVKIILVGVGRLGSALIRYKGFLDLNIKIIGAFDKDKKKIGKIIEGVKIRGMDEMKNFVEKEKIKIGIICVPGEAAQDVAEHMIKAGIKGILNFAPSSLVFQENIVVNYVDMASELTSIIFKLKNL